jgi:hypothetical protein
MKEYFSDNSLAKFELSVELGNDAMQTPKQLATVLRKVANMIEKNEYTFDDPNVRGILDANGNVVGFWKIEPRGESIEYLHLPQIVSFGLSKKLI